jgi:hypothetical protein
MTPSQKRVVRAVVALGIAAVVWWSVKQVLVAARESSPLEVTCADYLKAKPAAHWLRLTQCEPDLSDGHVVIEKSNSKATSVYVVLRPAGSKESNILLERDDPAMLELASKVDLSHLTDRIPMPGEAAPAPDPVMLKIVDELREPQEGLIAVPSSKTRDEVTGFNIGIDDQFTILERGKKPDSTLGLLGLFAAVIAAALLVRDIVVSRRPERPKLTIRS